VAACRRSPGKRLSSTCSRSVCHACEPTNGGRHVIVVATTANRRTWTTICRGSDGWVRSSGRITCGTEPICGSSSLLPSKGSFFTPRSGTLTSPPNAWWQGRSDSRLVVIPYEQEGENFTPVTIHATTRQQINFRLKTGRFKP